MQTARPLVSGCDIAMAALKTASLRHQHEALRQHMAELKANLNLFLLAQHATEVRATLTRLFGEFGKHLQQEAKDLYPALGASTDVKTKAVAERFSLEMKQTLPRLAEFNRRWPDAATIRSNASQFLKEADGMTQWLERRLSAEHAELYPLLDKMDVDKLGDLTGADLKTARI